MSDEAILDIIVEGYQSDKPATLEEERQRALEKIYSARQKSTILNAKMVAIETHGQGEEATPCAVVRIDTAKGIIPLEYMGAKDYRQLRNMTGTTISFKVIGIDKERDLFIGSRTAALEQLKDATFNRLEEAFKNNPDGVIVAASVRYVSAGYVVLQIGGIETSMSVSEYDYGWNSDLRQKVEVEDTLHVKVLNFNREKGTIQVSRKEAMPDPWDSVQKHFSVGNEYIGVVSGVTEYGNFINLMPGIDCLCPHMKFEALNAGYEVLVRIRNISTEERKIEARVMKVLKKSSR